MSVIRIIKGEFRNKAVVNKTFTLVKGYQTLKKGNYVTVKNEGQFPVAIDTVKVKVDNISMIEFVSGDSVSQNTLKVQPKVTETDEQAMNRIANRFCVLDKMSAATGQNVRSYTEKTQPSPTLPPAPSHNFMPITDHLDITTRQDLPPGSTPE
jgi:hypothetical protein